MNGKRDWILRALAESVLITFSILLALAVENWAEQQRNQELAMQSLSIFEREIRQNLARVEDVAPYHQGLRSVVAEMAGDPGRAVEVRSVLEGLEPPVLLNTAWETAVAVGSLTHMDFDIVQALSLTYSIQGQFQEKSRPAARPRMDTGELSAEGVNAVLAYITELERSESELLGIYAQALTVVREHLGEEGWDVEEGASGVRASAHP